MRPFVLLGILIALGTHFYANWGPEQEIQVLSSPRTDLIERLMPVRVACLFMACAGMLAAFLRAPTQPTVAFAAWGVAICAAIVVVLLPDHPRLTSNPFPAAVGWAGFGANIALLFLAVRAARKPSAEPVPAE